MYLQPFWNDCWYREETLKATEQTYVQKISGISDKLFDTKEILLDRLDMLDSSLDWCRLSFEWIFVEEDCVELAIFLNNGCAKMCRRRIISQATQRGETCEKYIDVLLCEHVSYSRGYHSGKYFQYGNWNIHLVASPRFREFIMIVLRVLHIHQDVPRNFSKSALVPSRMLCVGPKLKGYMMLY